MADGPELLCSAISHVVIEDGRRYLERTDGKYDVITLDPPPPVEAAGSSLLYSKEFYSVVRQRLRRPAAFCNNSCREETRSFRPRSPARFRNPFRIFACFILWIIEVFTFWRVSTPCSNAQPRR